MSAPPSPPEGLDDDIAEVLDGMPPERLRQFARYAENLAAHCEREDSIETGDEDERGSSGSGGSVGWSNRSESSGSVSSESESSGSVSSESESSRSENGHSGSNGPGDDSTTALPEDVPTKATTTIKEINDNRYYYWQWRDGDKIRSKYKGPVSEESDAE